VTVADRLGESVERIGRGMAAAGDSDGHRPPLHFVKKGLIEAIGEPGKSIVAANLCLFYEEETFGRSDFAGKWFIN